MTANMPAKHASWLHSHVHPLISGPELSRAANLVARSLFLGGSVRKLASRAGYFDRSSKCEPWY